LPHSARVRLRLEPEAGPVTPVTAR
jgi:hypothetical protein